MAGEIKTLQFSDGVSVTAPTTVTGQKHVEDDAATWDGVETTHTYTVSANISDSTKAMWSLRDAANDYIDIGGDVDFPAVTQVRFTFAVPPPAGTYRLVGIY